MKKLYAVILTAVICFLFISCGKAPVEEQGISTSLSQTVTVAETTSVLPEEHTTALPREDIKKGEQLKLAVLNALGDEQTAEIGSSTVYGSFTYRFNRDAKLVYANERNEELEKLARLNADSLVDAINDFYNDEIVFDRLYPAPIGNGDNGIDSVKYEIFYLNSQNQQLKICADSDGVISFVECKFTW